MSKQFHLLPETPGVKHINGFGPESVSLPLSGEFAAKPYDAGTPPKLQVSSCSQHVTRVDEI